MNNIDEILGKFNSPEMKAICDEIDRINDFEQQGYEVAASIAQVAGITPEELLLATVAAGEPDGPVANVQRTIGVIRWCLDQRRNGGTDDG